IVGGRGEPQIAKRGPQFSLELRRFWRRLHWIKGIEQPPFGGGAGHELRDPFGAAAARQRTQGADIEPALLCHMSRAEKASRSLFARAADSIIRQIATFGDSLSGGAAWSGA